jgi:hypothetical protein
VSQSKTSSNTNMEGVDLHGWALTIRETMVAGAWARLAVVAVTIGTDFPSHQPSPALPPFLPLPCTSVEQCATKLGSLSSGSRRRSGPREGSLGLRLEEHGAAMAGARVVDGKASTPRGSFWRRQWRGPPPWLPSSTRI